jgi:hypothetical protein
VIERAEPHRFDRVRSGRMGGQYRHRKGIQSRADALQNLDPVHAGHAKIE